MAEFVHRGQIDPANSEELTASWSVSDDATVEEMEAQALKRQSVLWKLIRRANETKLLKAIRVREERRKGIERARFAKVKIDESNLHGEDKAIATAMVKLEADIRADAEVAGEDADAVIARIRSEALQANGTAPPQ